MRFENAFHHVAPKLRQLARKYRHFCRFADEDDLLSEMQAHLLRRWQAGDLRLKAESFIVQSCYFHLRNYLRTLKGGECLTSIHESRRRDGEADNGDAHSLVERIPDAGADVQNAVEGNILYEGIMSNGFSRREKAIVRLLYDGFTVREIGKELALSHAMVVKIKKKIVRKVSKEHVSLLV